MNSLRKELEWFSKAVEIPRDLALMLKGATHKYIRRVPTQDSKGRRKYKYYYRVTGGHGLGHSNELLSGSAFKISHEGKTGHFHVQSRLGDDITIKHDESGKTMTVKASALRAMLRKEHAQEINDMHARATKRHDQAKKTGSKRQVARAKAHLERVSKVKGEPVKAKRGTREAVAKMKDAEHRLSVAESFLSSKTRKRTKSRLMASRIKRAKVEVEKLKRLIEKLKQEV